MNYTEKYHLPQWEKTDRIMMEDFNRMGADGGEGLREPAAAAATALSAANSKPSSSAVSNAQNTANQALAKANAAYCPDFKPYVTGTYTGKGDGQVNEVTVGFKPILLIITGQDKSSNASLTFSALLAEDTLKETVTFTGTGFTIQPQRYGGMVNDTKLWINERDRVYRYFAFR